MTGVATQMFVGRLKKKLKATRVATQEPMQEVCYGKMQMDHTSFLASCILSHLVLVAGACKKLRI